VSSPYSLKDSLKEAMKPTITAAAASQPVERKSCTAKAALQARAVGCLHHGGVVRAQLLSLSASQLFFFELRNSNAHGYYKDHNKAEDSLRYG
jgi:hypothetical protein